MRTKSYLFRILTFITLLLTLFAHPAGPALAADPVVRVMPAAPTVQVGQTVVVSITVDAVTNLFGLEFHMQFDPAVLEVVDANTAVPGVQIAPGSFLSPDIAPQNQANNTVGTIDFALSQTSPSTPVSGSGTLATITFRGRAAGSSTVAFTSVSLSNNVGATITASAQNGVVTVSATAPAATATSTAAAPTATTAPPTATTAPPTATTAPPTPTATVGAGATPAATPTATSTPVRTPTPVGPTPTPIRTTPTAPAQPSTCALQGHHVVRAGETLYSIGRAYATQPTFISSCNGIVNPSRIFIGTRLGIPTAAWTQIPAGPVAVRQFTPGSPPPAPGPTPGPTPVPATCRFYHTVQRGETLTRISIRYGSTIWAIGRANRINNLNIIFAGQVLCVP